MLILGPSGFGVVSQNFSVPVPNLSHFTFAAISATCMSVCPSCSDAHSDPRQEGALGERLRGPNFCGHVAGTVQGDTPRPHGWGVGRRCTCCARLSAEGSGRAGPRDAADAPGAGATCPALRTRTGASRSRTANRSRTCAFLRLVLCPEGAWGEAAPRR